MGSSPKRLPDLDSQRTALVDSFPVAFRAVRGPKRRILTGLREMPPEEESTPPRPSRAEQREKFKEMLALGLARDMADISRKVGVSRAWVTKVMKG